MKTLLLFKIKYKNKKKYKKFKREVNTIHIKNYSLKVNNRYLVKNSNLKIIKKNLYFLHL